MRRLRVMHVVAGGDIGGAERLLLDLASTPEASGADHEVALFTPTAALVDLFASAGLTLHDRGRVRENPLAFLARSLGPFDVAWLARTIRERKADIVHTHTLGSHVLGTRAARATGRPQLRTEHGVIYYNDPTASPFTRWASARTDRLVAVSEHVRRGILATAPHLAPRFVVVRNGVDTAHFAPRPRDPSRPFSVAIVCRLIPWKRVELAISAAAKAAVPLVVVGDGEERSRLERTARRLRAEVRFVGYQRDPRPFTAAADVTLSTSVEEPLGLSVLESLSMERPVIAVREGGVPEIVRDGETGWLVTATADAIADAIEEAKRDPARVAAMGRAARRFVVSECSIDAMCAQYGEQYRAVVKAHGRRAFAGELPDRIQEP